MLKFEGFIALGNGRLRFVNVFSCLGCVLSFISESFGKCVLLVRICSSFFKLFISYILNVLLRKMMARWLGGSGCSPPGLTTWTQYLGSPLEKERTDSHKWSSDLSTLACVEYTQNKKNVKKKQKQKTKVGDIFTTFSSVHYPKDLGTFLDNFCLWCEERMWFFSFSAGAHLCSKASAVTVHTALRE